MPHTRLRIQPPSIAPGSARRLAVQRFVQVGARPTIGLQATVHANELPGAMAPHQLQPLRVKANAAGRFLGKVVVVTTVNPIGLSQRVGNDALGRDNLLRRDKFNRNGRERSGAVTERVGALPGRDADARHAPGSGGAGVSLPRGRPSGVRLGPADHLAWVPLARRPTGRGSHR
jgi:predicted deacylase